MTTLAPFLGSTTRLALGLTFLHVKTTPASRDANLGLHGAGIVAAVDADRSCRISRTFDERRPAFRNRMG
jgi:hypothetical protein